MADDPEKSDPRVPESYPGMRDALTRLREPPSQPPKTHHVELTSTIGDNVEVSTKVESYPQATNAIEQSEQSSSENKTMPETSPKSDFWTYADKAMFGLCELLALLFGLPFGEDLYHDKTIASIGGWHWFYLGIAAVFAVSGPMWPWIRTRTWLPPSVAESLSKAPLDARLWIAALLLLFLYVTAPEIYQRATAPSAPPTVIHDPPTADDIAKAAAPIQAQLEAAQKTIADLRKAPIGFTQEQVNQKVIAATALLRAQLEAANAALAGAKANQPIRPSPEQTSVGPIDWGGLSWGQSGDSRGTVFPWLLVSGRVGPSPIQIKRAYLQSDLTGERREMLIHAGRIDVAEIFSQPRLHVRSSDINSEL